MIETDFAAQIIHHGSEFRVVRISDYSHTQSGKLCVMADTLETLNDGIGWVLKRYPEQGYGTMVHQLNQDKAGTWWVNITHWGAD